MTTWLKRPEQLEPNVLTTFLAYRQPLIIALDGVDAAGKSTLGRYLAWQLGMAVIETDLFLIQATGCLDYRLDALGAVTKTRLDHDRPVLFEGVRALRTLRLLGLEKDFLVWVEQDGREASPGFQAELTKYSAEFEPLERADFVSRRAAE